MKWYEAIEAAMKGAKVLVTVINPQVIICVKGLEYCEQSRKDDSIYKDFINKDDSMHGRSSDEGTLKVEFVSVNIGRMCNPIFKRCCFASFGAQNRSPSS